MRAGRVRRRGFQASRRGGFMRAIQTLSSVRLLGQVAVYLRGELDPSIERQGGTPLRAPVDERAARAGDVGDAHVLEHRELRREPEVLVHEGEAARALRRFRDQGQTDRLDEIGHRLLAVLRGPEVGVLIEKGQLVLASLEALAEVDGTDEPGEHP